jgi:hypothetical protein
MKPKNPRLSAALANAGMTWRQLAKSVGCTPACLHGIATGRNLLLASSLEGTNHGLWHPAKA